MNIKLESNNKGFIEEINKILEEKYIKDNTNHFILLNYKDLFDIIPGVFFNGTGIHFQLIESIDFEYNYDNEYKVFVNEILAGYFYRYPYVDENIAFEKIEDFCFKSLLRLGEEDYLKEQINSLNESFLEQEKKSSSFFKDILNEKTPFYRKLEFRHKKKEFRCQNR